MERFAIEVVAFGDSGQGLSDPHLRVKELNFDRSASGERDDRSRMNLVAPVRVRGVRDRDRDRVGGAVVVCSHPQNRRKTVITKSGIGRPSPVSPASRALPRASSSPRGGVQQRRVDIVRADPVEPHLVSRVTAEPHTGGILPTPAAETMREDTVGGTRRRARLAADRKQRPEIQGRGRQRRRSSHANSEARVAGDAGQKQQSGVLSSRALLVRSAGVADCRRAPIPAISFATVPRLFSDQRRKASVWTVRVSVCDRAREEVHFALVVRCASCVVRGGTGRCR